MQVPEEYVDARLKDFDDCVDQEKISWDRYGFSIRGGTGIGKTHIATALAVEYLKPTHKDTIVKNVLMDGELIRYSYDKKDFVWISAPTLIVRIRSTFNGAPETEYDVLKEMMDAKVMVLDDLGAQNSSDFSASTIYAILSERRNRQRVTIVTSNQELVEINKWEPRIASRLGELSSIKLPAVDRRIEKAKK